MDIQSNATANSLDSLVKVLRFVFCRLQLNCKIAYLSVYVDDQFDKLKLVFSSNVTWNKIFIEEEFIYSCPLVKIRSKIASSGKSRNFLLKWDMVKPTTSIQKNVCYARHDFGIGDGLSVGTSKDGYKVITGFCPNYNDVSFYKKLYNNLQTLTYYHNIIETAILRYIKKLEPDNYSLITLEPNKSFEYNSFNYKIRA